MNRIEHHLTADSAKLDPSRFLLLSKTLDLHHSTPQHRIDPSIMFPEKMSANATEWRFPSLGPFARDHFPFISGLSFCISLTHWTSHATILHRMQTMSCRVVPPFSCFLKSYFLYLDLEYSCSVGTSTTTILYLYMGSIPSRWTVKLDTSWWLDSSWYFFLLVGLGEPLPCCEDFAWMSSLDRATCFYDVAGEMVLTIVLAPCLHFEMSTTCLWTIFAFVAIRAS